jgi:pilus assembly protein CpaF
MSEAAFAGWNPNLLVGLAPLVPLLEDEEITNIDAVGFDDVRVKGQSWRGHKRLPEVRWESFEHFRFGCIRVSQEVGRPIGEDKPILNARLPGGHRVNIAIPPVCERIALTIRKFPAQPMTFEVLEAKGSINKAVRQICTSLVRARRTILVAGGCDAGKTSLLNAFSTAFPANAKIVTLEDVKELRIQQPVWTAMETMEPHDRDVEPVAMADLVRNVYRQNPGRIVVGEVRGEEAFYMLDTFASGHPGGLATVHANSAEDALHRVQLLAQRAPASGHSAQVVAGMVGRGVDVVVYQEYFEEENIRRISEIIELESPGVIWQEGGRFEYSVRRLVQWDAERKTWMFPTGPSAQLRRLLSQKGLGWPEESLAVGQGQGG